MAESENIIYVNGRKYTVEESQLHMPLLQWLRDVLHLTGAKCGCGNGQCGSCSVLIDGDVKRSCLYKMEKILGKHVTTIEGIAVNGKLHPVQESFIVCGVMQCGFCTPGQIITAVGLLNKIPEPTRADIDKAFRGDLCRCGSYPRVIKAVQRASAILCGKPWKDEDLTAGEDVLGRSYPMADAVDKVTGKMKFTDDFRFPNMIHGKLVFTDIPCGRLVSLDTAAAEAAPGVVYVLSYKNAREFRYGPIARDVPVLCSQNIRSYAEPIAAVFAETQEQAEAAAKLIKAEYEEIPGIFTPEEALAPGARLVDEEAQDNVVSHIRIEKGDLEKAFAESDIVLERDYYSQKIDHAYIETEGAIAVPTGEGMDLYSMTQAPFSCQENAARFLGVDKERVNAIQVPIGGSFGGKGDDMVRMVCVEVAEATGRPAHLQLTRAESLRYHPKRHPFKQHYKVGAMKDGTLKAMDITYLADGGAYRYHSHRVLAHAVSYCTGPYKVDNVRCDGTVVLTNNVSCGAMRGYGVAQSSVGSEIVMDELARELHMDPIQLRRKNAVRPGDQMPDGQVLHVGHHYVETLDVLEAKIRDELEPLRKQYDNVGIGVATIWRYVGGGLGPQEESFADIELESNGRLYLRSSISEMGNESQVAMRQLVAKDLDVPYEIVDMAPITTKNTPWGGSVMASRGMWLWGHGVLAATREFRKIVMEEASRLWVLPPERIIMKNGSFYDEDGMELGTLADIAFQADLEHRQIVAHGHHVCKETHFPREDCNATGAVPVDKYQPHHTSSFTSLGVAVQVDREKKAVKVLKLVAVLDIGHVLNPEAARRQIEGGFIMGQGMALTEEFSEKDGISDVKMLSKLKLVDVQNTPEMDITLLDLWDPSGPYGAKGVGEISLPAMMPAVVNAYFDATGERVRELPLLKHI